MLYPPQNKSLRFSPVAIGTAHNVAAAGISGVLFKFRFFIVLWLWGISLTYINYIFIVRRYLYVVKKKLTAAITIYIKEV